MSEIGVAMTQSPTNEGIVKILAIRMATSVRRKICARSCTMYAAEIAGTRLAASDAVKMVGKFTSEVAIPVKYPKSSVDSSTEYPATAKRCGTTNKSMLATTGSMIFANETGNASTNKRFKIVLSDSRGNVVSWSASMRRRSWRSR